MNNQKEVLPSIIIFFFISSLIALPLWVNDQYRLYAEVHHTKCDDNKTDGVCILELSGEVTYEGKIPNFYRKYIK